MKKKIWTGILAAALAFFICSTNALAAEPQCPGCRGRYNADETWVSFADENEDGIWDDLASGACEGGYGCGAGGSELKDPRCLWHIAEDGSWVCCVDADGDGVCDTCGVTLPLRTGFVDEDGDGICDNASSDTCRVGHCGGTGRRGGGRGGRRR